MSVPPSPLRVAVAQMTSIDDVPTNTNQLMQLVQQVTDPDKIDLVCFPENALFLRLQKNQNEFGMQLSDPIFSQVGEFCQKHSCSVLLGSVPLLEEGHRSNATVLIGEDGASQVVYRKVFLFDVDVEGEKSMRESDQFEPGHQAAVVTVNGWKLGLSICYDLRFSELFHHYARLGVHALLVPAAFTVPTGQAHWQVLLRARAIESQAYLLAAAQAGQHVGVSGARRETYGHSMVVDPWGVVIAENESAKPGLIYAELDPERLQWVRQQIPMSDHRRQFGLRS